jgi:hypothetical protein
MVSIDRKFFSEVRSCGCFLLRGSERRCGASAAMLMRSVLFWDITRRRVVTVYRRFGTTYRFLLQKSRVFSAWTLDP